MGNKLVIKKARLKDADTLAKVGRRTFTETYSRELPKLELKRYVSEHFNPKAIALELKNSGFFIAYLAQRLAGYSKTNISRNAHGKKDSRCSELERVYVLKEFRGRGIGNALLKRFEHAARERGNTFV